MPVFPANQRIKRRDALHLNGIVGWQQGGSDGSFQHFDGDFVARHEVLLFIGGCPVFIPQQRMRYGKGDGNRRGTASRCGNDSLPFF